MNADPSTPQPTSQATADIDPGTGYADALAELDGILAELETADVDVDRLGDQVARAAQLIEFCRGRIDNAKVTIERVVADLNADT